MGERFCKLNMVWANAYEECFQTYYNTIHRYETNRLRNIARFFGHRAFPLFPFPTGYVLIRRSQYSRRTRFPGSSSTQSR